MKPASRQAGPFAEDCFLNKFESNGSALLMDSEEEKSISRKEGETLLLKPVFLNKLESKGSALLTASEEEKCTKSQRGWITMSFS